LVIKHAGRRYGLGTSADSVVIGDWNCDGLPTPALLQRSTGIVAIFNAWPESGKSRVPEYTTVESNAEILVSEATDGCDRLRARGPYGSTIITPEQP